ncbi:hypothetical protein EVAR_102537_1, partial [Eumeta japonica]
MGVGMHSQLLARISHIGKAEGDSCRACEEEEIVRRYSTIMSMAHHGLFNLRSDALPNIIPHGAYAE